MNKDQVKGTINDVEGRVKRQVGEWTGDEDAQVEGTVQQIKGKAQTAWGNVKDAAHSTTKDVETEKDKERAERAEQTHVRHDH